MTDQELARLVHAHVRHDEPPFALSPERSMALGRRTLVRRRVRRGGLGLVLATGAVVLGLTLAHDPTGPTTGSVTSPATSTRQDTPQQTATVLDRRARAVFGRSVPDLGPMVLSEEVGGSQTAGTGFDSEGRSTSATYGDGTGHRLQVLVGRVERETEADARGNCASELAVGYWFRCTVSTDEQGDTVTITVQAVIRRPGAAGGYDVITQDQLRTDATLRSSQVLFRRSVDSVRDGTVLTVAEEMVRAPDLAAADAAWQVPVADLTELATDPDL